MSCFKGYHTVQDIYDKLEAAKTWVFVNLGA